MKILPLLSESQFELEHDDFGLKFVPARFLAPVPFPSEWTFRSRTMEAFIKDGRFHRDGNYAVWYPYYCYEWYLNGRLHRLDGAAKCYSKRAGHKDVYAIFGTKLSEDEWREAIEDLSNPPTDAQMMRLRLAFG